MKVLIIGGMGVIGGAITEAASKKDIEVYVVSRRKPFEKWKDLPVHYIQGNWKDDAFAEKLVSGNFDVIVDTQIFNEDQLIRSTRIVNNHCTQFFYISTDSVYKHPSINLKEDDDIDISDISWKYGYDKRIAELYLESHSAEYSFYWTVIRPTITFGDTRIPVGFSSKRNTYTLADRIINKKPIIRFDDPKTEHAICHTSIFGEAVCALFLNESSRSNAYHISDDKGYTYDEIFSAIEDIVGEEALFVHLDTNLVKKYSKSVYEEMIYDKNPTFTLDNSKIKSLCPNVVLHKDIHEAMGSTLDNLKAHSEQVGEDTDYNLISDCLLFFYHRTIKDDNERRIAEQYVNGLTLNYRNEIKRFDRKTKVNNLIRTCKSKLRPLKKLIIRK